MLFPKALMRTSLILLLLAGCSCNPRTSETSTTESPSTETTSSGTSEEATPDYEVHEWGLINVASEGIELAAGPGQPQLIQDLGVQGYGKPVLYFHLAENSPSFDARVDVNLRGFLLGEHYPLTEGAGRTIHWEGRLEREPCTLPRAYPTLDACPVSQDGYCEAAELASYETAHHSCFHIGDAEWPLLFYRGVPQENRPTLPLSFGLTLEGNAVAQRTDAASETIGQIWYMVDHEVRAIAEWPAPGEAVNLLGAPPADPRAQLRAQLIEHGLTEEEAQAFGNAWFEELFGTPSVEGGGTLGLRGTGRGGGGTGEGTIGLGNAENTGGLLGHMPPMPIHRLVYWLPGAEHGAMTELAFEPAPSAIHRATLVRDRASAQ